MNKLIQKNSLIGMALLLFLGCGSSDKSSNEPIEPKELKKLSFKVSRADVSQRIGRQAGTNTGSKAQRKQILKLKSYKNFEEEGRYECKVSGSFTLSFTEDKDRIYVYDSCVYPDGNTNKKIYEDGAEFRGATENPTIYAYNKYTYVSDYENYPGSGVYYEELGVGYYNKSGEQLFYIDGTEASFENKTIQEVYGYKEYVYKEKSNSKFYVEGTIGYKTKCVSQSYTYKTSENDWLAPHDSNSEYLKSGTIVINGLKYTYKNNNVTLSKNGKTETYPQEELLDYQKDVASNNSCSSPNKLIQFTEKPNKNLDYTIFNVLTDNLKKSYMLKF